MSVHGGRGWAEERVQPWVTLSPMYLEPLLVVRKRDCRWLIAGFAGNRIGAIRDAKGRSVASVFTGLESSQKAEVSCSTSCSTNGLLNDRFSELLRSKCWGQWDRARACHHIQNINECIDYSLISLQNIGC
jgi:hypothetical protein